MKQKLEVEVEVPEGYKVVDYRVPVVGDQYLDLGSIMTCSRAYLVQLRFILKKAHKLPELIMYIGVTPDDCEADTNIMYHIATAHKIEHICTYDGFDIIKATDHDIEYLYLGHWNDGMPTEEVE